MPKFVFTMQASQCPKTQVSFHLFWYVLCLPLLLPTFPYPWFTVLWPNEVKHYQRDDKWFLELPSETEQLLQISVKHEKCVNVRMLVYEMQVRLGESLWSILGKMTLQFLSNFVSKSVMSLNGTSFASATVQICTTCNLVCQLNLWCGEFKNQNQSFLPGACCEINSSLITVEPAVQWFPCENA